MVGKPGNGHWPKAACSTKQPVPESGKALEGLMQAEQIRSIFNQKLRWFEWSYGNRLYFGHCNWLLMIGFS